MRVRGAAAGLMLARASVSLSLLITAIAVFRSGWSSYLPLLGTRERHHKLSIYSRKGIQIPVRQDFHLIPPSVFDVQVEITNRSKHCPNECFNSNTSASLLKEKAPPYLHLVLQVDHFAETISLHMVRLCDMAPTLSSLDSLQSLGKEPRTSIL